ncbi:IS607 family transposase [Acetobacterium fimetarium]|uniref:IS607 family transposase n=1 Tax=Acetobacterium fimetarium TaxID=52691 RepID=A0ABR6WWZ0_9FIRM|nr:IS607 family transposase [Acetobacterium fimetarium]MBC3805065.1 IS607 family transposase [Acetobacterium fimetarium]
MELLSIGKFAKRVGVDVVTLRRMEKSGELIPAHKSEGGTRYYSIEQLKQFTSKSDVKKLTIGYCRVSTPSQKDDLETQVENVKSYMIARGYQFNVITDIGSGINYNKKGLKELIDKINSQMIDRIVILYKDRLVRFGYEMIEYFCHINGVELEVIDHTEKTKEAELTDDLVQIITVFANRLYGQRSKKTKRLIDEVKQHDTGDTD